MSKNVYVYSSKRQRIQNLKDEINLKFQEGKKWVIDNKEAIILLAPVAIGGLTTITKVVGKHVNLRKEESLKDKYCYDRSLGHYWRLKRKLSNSEWVTVERRKNNGERLADILSDLRVLK